MLFGFIVLFVVQWKTMSATVLSLCPSSWRPEQRLKNYCGLYVGKTLFPFFFLLLPRGFGFVLSSPDREKNTHKYIV